MLADWKDDSDEPFTTKGLTISWNLQAIQADAVWNEENVNGRGVVVVAGGQALVRAARRSVLSRAGIDVVAEVADASRAAKAAELYGPGLVLIDSEIPGGCVLAVRRVVERAPASAVLVVAPELDAESSPELAFAA